LTKGEPIKILSGREYLRSTFSVYIMAGTAGKSKGKMGGCPSNEDRAEFDFAIAVASIVMT